LATLDDKGMEVMADINIWAVSGAILTSLGGGALIVAALFKWLGELTAKHILQKEQGKILKSIEELKQELGLVKSNYEKNAEWIIDFYSMFYRHYQLAYRVARADIIRHPDKPDENTKKNYMDQVDNLADEWNRKQGVARILLPSNILELHETTIDKFNDFKDAVKGFDCNNQESRTKVEDCFKEIHRLKNAMENSVRQYLRSEELAK
jgi:archaellum component FlaC